MISLGIDQTFDAECSFMTGVIMSIAFGYNLKGEKDVYVTKTEAFAEAIIDSMSPTSSIVNVFPIRAYRPVLL